MDRCGYLKERRGKVGKGGDLHKQKTTPTYIRFLWPIFFFVWANTGFETYFRPHTVVAFEGVEEISLKRSTHTEAKHQLKHYFQKMIKMIMMTKLTSSFLVSMLYYKYKILSSCYMKKESSIIVNLMVSYSP